MGTFFIFSSCDRLTYNCLELYSETALGALGLPAGNGKRRK